MSAGITKLYICTSIASRAQTPMHAPNTRLSCGARSHIQPNAPLLLRPMAVVTVRSFIALSVPARDFSIAVQSEAVLCVFLPLCLGVPTIALGLQNGEQ